MERADKRRNRLLLIKHTHVDNTRPFSKTHKLILVMEGADKERNRLLLVKCTHIQTQDHSVKLTSCMLAMERAYKERNRLQIYMLLTDFATAGPI